MTDIVSSGIPFDQILSHLVTLYRRGVLVPFIGSGMSRDTCPAWRPLLQNLALRVLHPATMVVQEEPTAALYRLADEIVTALRALPWETRAEVFRSALQNWPGNGPAPIPENTKQLARLFWPLVLTTNYDDLFWGATDARARPGAFPHFALLPTAEKSQFNERFLQTRLGITPVFYPDYKDVAVWLMRLASLAGEPEEMPLSADQPLTVVRPLDLSFEVMHVGRAGRT